MTGAAPLVEVVIEPTLAEALGRLFEESAATRFTERANTVHAVDVRADGRAAAGTDGQGFGFPDPRAVREQAVRIRTGETNTEAL